MSGNERTRNFTAGLCGAHRTLTLSGAGVECSPALARGWWCVKVVGDSCSIKVETAEITSIPVTEGAERTWMRDGETEYFFLETAGYIAAVRDGSTTVVVHLQKR